MCVPLIYSVVGPRNLWLHFLSLYFTSLPPSPFYCLLFFERRRLSFLLSALSIGVPTFSPTKPQSSPLVLDGTVLYGVLSIPSKRNAQLTTPPPTTITTTMSDDGPAPAGGPPVSTGGAAAAVGSTQNGDTAHHHTKEVEVEKKPIVITKSHFETDASLSRPMSAKSSVDLEDYFVRLPFSPNGKSRWWHFANSRKHSRLVPVIWMATPSFLISCGCMVALCRE